MEPVQVVIIDDESHARDIIRNYLLGCSDLRVAAECSNGFEGLKRIQELRPDIVFLDIQMPKLNGFEMLELMEESPVIIFSTAYDQYAIKAFEVNAADYLLKPYSRERFKAALDNALQMVKSKQPQKQVLQNLVNYRDDTREYLERVLVKTNSKIIIIPVDQLFWLEAQDDYVMLHCRHGDFLKQQTMRYFESKLDPGEFTRIHRSHLVKISSIKHIETSGRESYRVILTSGKSLPVSKTGHAKLKQILR